MASLAVCLSLAFVLERIPHPFRWIIIFVLIAVHAANTLRQLGRQVDDHLDLDDLDPNPGAAPRAAPEIHESSESEEASPGSPRPQLPRHDCSLCGQDELACQRMPNDSTSDSALTPQSDESEFVDCEDAASARPSTEVMSIADDVEERLRSRKNSLEPFPPFPEMEFCEDAEDPDKKTRLRFVKMRDEGTPVKVSYAQLSGLTPTTRTLPPAPAAAAVDPSPSTSGTSNSSLPSSQQPSNPAPTPCDLTGITTPDHHQASSSLAPQKQSPSTLPTSGRAGAVLDVIDEKLLAVPADAVSRRLLRDGRALLRRDGRLPMSISFATSVVRPTKSVKFGREAGELEDSYPSDMME
ncbi:hypothetical protein Daus18300_010875 [Diaporthe australafricana]|uniref:Uncharacterized protein n=1 Tax=Diaporthe australafricana TaxID=127596 RepID=A0ABR3W8I7_9PEZI